MIPIDHASRFRTVAARAVALWGPVAGYCVLIFLLSSSSHLPDLPHGFSDKNAHLLLYSGLGFLVARAVAGGVGRPFPGWTIAVAVAFSVLYGLTDEAHQLFVPRRHFDLMDLAADGIGASVGAVLLWLWGIIAPTQRTG
ncbi:MAG: teicoplanin resistance protein VanZ [Acidobacteria bacterium]|nr:MAG: teicoplanin resistance protein VanZ [Acidobacteriota bacterium]